VDISYFIRLPVTKFASRRRRRRQIDSGANNNTTKSSSDKEEDSSLSFDLDFDEDKSSEVPANRASDFDPSVSLTQEFYCEILADLDEECWESNLAEMWSYDKNAIDQLSQEDVLAVVNHEQNR
jgi:hypothetical protein